MVPATPQPSTALWWVPDAGRPTLEQALARLAHLRRHGPTPQAFGVRRRFDPSGRPEASAHPRGGAQKSSAQKSSAQERSQ